MCYLRFLHLYLTGINTWFIRKFPPIACWRCPPSPYRWQVIKKACDMWQGRLYTLLRHHWPEPWREPKFLMSWSRANMTHMALPTRRWPFDSILLMYHIPNTNLNKCSAYSSTPIFSAQLFHKKERRLKFIFSGCCHFICTCPILSI
jgi:hypothetical protein